MGIAHGQRGGLEGRIAGFQPEPQRRRSGRAGQRQRDRVRVEGGGTEIRAERVHVARPAEHGHLLAAAGRPDRQALAARDPRVAERRRQAADPVAGRFGFRAVGVEDAGGELVGRGVRRPHDHAVGAHAELSRADLFRQLGQGQAEPVQVLLAEQEKIVAQTLALEEGDLEDAHDGTISRWYFRMTAMTSS